MSPRKRRRQVLVLGAGTVLLASIALILAGTRGTGSETGRQPTSRETGAATTRVSGAEGGRATPVPILMYHVIADPPASAPFPELFVRPRDFAGEMAWLARHRYHVVTLRAVWDSWHRGGSLPSRPIVVSFDDGYRSDVGEALPVLKRHGWAGVLNLKVGNIDPGNLRPRGVRRLIAAGWEIDAHSITHPDLTTVDDRRLEYEVLGSRKALRRMFHVPVDFFCYPAGRYDARVVAAVRRGGFLGATTTKYGLARPSEPYTLDRVRVNGDDGVSGFAAKLTALAG